MSDDRSNRGSPDRVLISTAEDYEIRYWMSSLGVTRDELLAAINAVGNSAEKVRDYLKRQ